MAADYLCEGKNRKGLPCRNRAVRGSQFCEYHQNPDNPKPTVSAKWAAVARAVKERPEAFAAKEAREPEEED